MGEGSSQDEIDALLKAGQTVEDGKGHACNVDDIVSQTLAEVNGGNTTEVKEVSVPASAQISGESEKENASPVRVNVDTVALNVDDSFEKIRAAQKILFEVFSNIPDKKERTRLINWANDAFIKSKYF